MYILAGSNSMGARGGRRSYVGLEGTGGGGLGGGGGIFDQISRLMSVSTCVTSDWTNMRHSSYIATLPGEGWLSMLDSFTMSMLCVLF